MNARRCHAALSEKSPQAIRAMLRACEHEGLAYQMTLEKREQQRRLEFLPHGIDGLGDPDRRRGLAVIGV